MLTTKDLAGSYGRNLGNIQKVMDGITDSECNYQPPFNSNCINWVLGHILNNRNRAIQFLGEKPILTEEQHKRYGYGSPPVCTAEPGVLTVGQMMELLLESQPRIEAGMAAISAAELAREVEYARRKMTVEQALLMGVCHDFTHTGELTILREAAVSCRPGPRGEEIYMP